MKTYITERTVLHCDMNNFFASVEIMKDPSLAPYPVAVCGSSEERHGIVLAKNYHAKKYGIQTGEPTVSAKRKCPSLITVSPHYDDYIKYSRLAKKIYSRYTDMVEPFGADECWLDVSGSKLLFGDGQNIADEIRQTVKKELGLTVSVGVSFNKTFAKLGSDLKKPDAVTVISKEDFKEKIWHLPASSIIGIGASTEKRLRSFGINTIGELAGAYEPMLKSILGINGIRLKEIANGIDNCPGMKLSDSVPVKSVSRGMTTRCDLNTYEEIKNLMSALCQDISSRLMSYGRMAAGVSVYLRDCNLNTRQCQKKLNTVTDSAWVLTNEAYDIMRKKLPLCSPIRSVTVAAIDLCDSTQPLQLDFFNDTSDVFKHEKLDRVLNDINIRYGDGTVIYANSALSEFKSGNAFGFGAVTENL